MNCKNEESCLRKSVFPFSKWHSRREVRMAKRYLKYFWQEDEEVHVASWARWEAQWKGSVELERRCQDISREIQMLDKRREIFQSAIEGKLRVQDRASERLQDQIIEEIKDMENTKDRRSLANSGERA